MPLGALVLATLAAGPPPATLVEPATGMVLVPLPAGTFTMGSPLDERMRSPEEILHEESIARGLYIGRDEVTQAEWLTVMGDNPSHFAGCPRCPVENVNYFDVERFLERLNRSSPLGVFRLPSEAEWEYACRAASATPFDTGTTLTTAEANFNGNYPYDGAAPGVRRNRTLPVGSFPPNAWGLRDMHGNVWEWTSSVYGPYRPGAAVDPQGLADGPKRVIRGGSYAFDAASARCAARYHHAEVDCGPSLGFRVVLKPAHTGGDATRRRAAEDESEPRGGRKQPRPTPP